MMDTIAYLINTFNNLNLSEVIDFDKFNHYSIVHHSTAIEGSTLSDIETQVLLSEGISPKGKPLIHSMMVKDQYESLIFVMEEAKKNTPISPALICTINAAVMKTTGTVCNTVLGPVDASKGEFRKGNVSAGSTYFVGYDKVPSLVEELCKKITDKQKTSVSLEDKLNLSFDAHFDLVTIHPFYDGNGRTSRLLMNYLQRKHQLPLAIVFKEDKVDYIQALQKTRQEKDEGIFRKFMLLQYEKHLSVEIKKYKESFER
jgi:Fic family protein